MTKTEKGDQTIRIWSAGCSTGEEPYSVAILVSEFLEKNDPSLTPFIFATDLDVNVITKAKDAVYTLEDVEDVRYGHLLKHFNQRGSYFKLKSGPGMICLRHALNSRKGNTASRQSSWTLWITHLRCVPSTSVKSTASSTTPIWDTVRDSHW